MINDNEYAPFYKGYVQLASSYDLFTGLDETLDLCLNLYESISPQQGEYAYADGKWTVKQLIAHVIDTERIFQYRALRIAREKAIVLALMKTLSLLTIELLIVLSQNSKTNSTRLD